MQFQYFAPLVRWTKIVILVVTFAMTFCGCGRKEKAVFTDTEFSAVSSTTEGSSDHETDGSGAGCAEDGANTGQTVLPAKGYRTILVFVCGAVQCEGVYELPEGSRVIDAVNAAGGYRKDADSAYINQAEYVYDAQKVEIPTEEEARELREEGMSGSAQDPDSASGDGRININTANMDELMRIPGIGESKAGKILEYREEHGRFGSTEEIMNISGIGSGNYEKMKDYISVK